MSRAYRSAGWYQDPGVACGHRYWNGEAWFDDRLPTESVESTPSPA